MYAFTAFDINSGSRLMTQGSFCLCSILMCNWIELLSMKIVPGLLDFSFYKLTLTEFF